MALTKYKIVNQKQDKDKVLHPQALQYPNKKYILNADILTDEEAKELFELKSPYIEEIAAVKEEKK